MWLKNNILGSTCSPQGAWGPKVILMGFCVLSTMLWPVMLSSQEIEAAGNNKKIKASRIKYANRKSGLRAKSVQAAIDEIGSGLHTILSGKGRRGRSTMKATTTTSWTGKRYFYAGELEGKYGPPETLQEAEVTMTFTPTNESSGSLTVTPVNFVCEIEREFTMNGEGVCGPYGDVFSYSYRIFGSNLFVENGRTSSGSLIGEGVLGGAGSGYHVDIQSKGPQRLVLKYRDLVVSVWDLQLSN